MKTNASVFLQPTQLREQFVQDADTYVEGTVAIVAPHRFEIATRDNRIFTLMTTIDTEIWEGRWVNLVNLVGLRHPSAMIRHGEYRASH